MTGYSKVSVDFIFHCRRKTANLIGTDRNFFISKHSARGSAILAKTVIFKHNFLPFCQGIFRNSAILAWRGNEQKVRHFRRHFDIVY